MSRKRTGGRPPHGSGIRRTENAAKAVRRRAHSDQLGAGHRIEGITSTAMRYCRVCYPSAATVKTWCPVSRDGISGSSCLRRGLPGGALIRHIAVGLDARRAVDAGAAMAHQAVRQTYSAYLRNPASARNTTSRQLRLYSNTPIAPLSVGRVRDGIGSLGYSLKRARLQTGLSLLEYPHSPFCSTERDRTPPWLLRIEKTVVCLEKQAPH